MSASVKLLGWQRALPKGTRENVDEWRLPEVSFNAPDDLSDSEEVVYEVLSKPCILRKPCEAQVKGDCRLSEFSSENEPDEYIFEVTAEAAPSEAAPGDEAAREALRAAVAALQPAIFQRLEQYAQELKEL